MPFGLKNAPSTFQRFMAKVIFGLEFVFCYIDDILVASSSLELHHGTIDKFYRIPKPFIVL